MLSEVLVVFFVLALVLALRWWSIKAYVIKNISANLRRPGGGFWGFVCRQFLKGNNMLEEVAYDKLSVEPHHNLLELGFGYGHGLEYVLRNWQREGSGTVYGVDYSEQVCEHVRKTFAKDIERGNLLIYNEDVAALPLEDGRIDRVCHTNCYYFWSDRMAVCKEILRVMKPGGLMVTGIQYDRVRAAAASGMLSKSGTDLDSYVTCLMEAGFENVRKEFVKGLPTGVSEVQVVYAEKGSD